MGQLSCLPYTLNPKPYDLTPKVNAGVNAYVSFELHSL